MYFFQRGKGEACSRSRRQNRKSRPRISGVHAESSARLSLLPQVSGTALPGGTEF